MGDGRPVAVVTGAGRGIGRAIALGLAGAGADLVLAGRDADALSSAEAATKERGADALPVIADVTDENAVAELAARTIERYGRVDVVVANSGIGGPSGPVWELSRAEWDETLAVNVTGVWLTARAFLPHMVERGDGTFIAIGSMTGKRPLWGRTPYAASKTALIGLVRTLAVETAAAGVRVNLVSPGPVASERMEWVFRAQAEGRGITEEQARREMLDQIPIGRLIEPEEVADAVVALAFGRLTAVTGQDLNVSGGMVMY